MRDFSRWIEQYNEKLGLKYSQFGWTQGLDVELHDVQCSFNFCGKLFLGRGTDESENVAIVKATAEVLERYFLDQLSVAETSNGVAVHTIITDHYFAPDEQYTGLEFAALLRKCGFNGRILLASNGEFQPENLKGIVDKIVDKQPVEWEELKA